MSKFEAVRNQARNMKTIGGLILPVLLSLQCFDAFAVDIVDERKDGPKVTVAGDIAVVETTDGWSYTIAAIPDEAKQLKFFTVIPVDFQGKKEKAALENLSVGEKVTRDEVISALDAYFHEVAFDYDSIKLRKLEVGSNEYAAWCDNYLITCLGWQFRAGSLVTFEENGRNRNGGMTGFEAKAYMVRKVKTAESAASQAPVAPGVVVTAATSKPPVETLQIARAVLEAHGYKIRTVNESEGTLSTTANPGLLSIKNADCGKYFGIPNLMDKRAYTEITITVKATDGKVELSSSIDAVFKSGYGAPDRPLTCTSKGILENELLEEIKKQL